MKSLNNKRKVHTSLHSLGTTPKHIRDKTSRPWDEKTDTTVTNQNTITQKKKTVLLMEEITKALSRSQVEVSLRSATTNLESCPHW